MRRIPVAPTAEHFWPWFVRDQQWARAGLPLAAVLGILAAILRPALGQSRLLIFLNLPAYMLHQYEEHGHGAFKADVARMFPNARGVTDLNICIVNLTVWAVDLASFSFSCMNRLAQSLLAPYLAVLNGFLHLAIAIRQRRYNPGLVTGVLLLLPLGGVSVRRVARAGRASRRDHLLAFGGAVFLHLLTAVAIMFLGKRNDQ